MAYTQADIDALDAEIAKVRAVKTTTFSDQSTTFRDLKELLELRSLMTAEVNAAAGTQKNYRLAATRKGV